MRLDRADHDVDALGDEVARDLEHPVGLPDAGREAEEDLEPRPPLGRLLRDHPREHTLGIGSVGRMGRRHGRGPRGAGSLE